MCHFALSNAHFMSRFDITEYTYVYFTANYVLSAFSSNTNIKTWLHKPNKSHKGLSLGECIIQSNTSKHVCCIIK